MNWVVPVVADRIQDHRKVVVAVAAAAAAVVVDNNLRVVVVGKDGLAWVGEDDQQHTRHQLVEDRKSGLRQRRQAHSHCYQLAIQAAPRLHSI